jgi:hypothetical protein
VAGHSERPATIPGLPGATRELYGVRNASGYPPGALAALVVLVSLSEEVLGAAARARLDHDRLPLLARSARGWAKQPRFRVRYRGPPFAAQGFKGRL